jgi:hypothetical protein
MLNSYITKMMSSSYILPKTLIALQFDNQNMFKPMLCAYDLGYTYCVNVSVIGEHNVNVYKISPTFNVLIENQINTVA